MPKVFGWQHLTYLAIFFVLATLSLVLAKIFLKGKRGQTIFIKVLAGLTFASNLVCRIAVAVRGSNIRHFYPYTICSLTSFALPLAVLCGKEDLDVYQALWYLGFVGGLGTLVYPDFIGQNQSFFYLATITGLLHHSFIFMLSIAMLMFGWFRPNIKKCYYFPMVFCGYITAGAFAQHVLEIDGSMLITEPILNGTPIDCWFILCVGSAGIALIALVYELVKKYILKKRPVEQCEVQEGNCI